MSNNIIAVYDRVYVEPHELPALLRSYLAFYDATATIRFTMPAMDMNVIGLESSTVNFSIVSAPAAALDEFRETGQTILVADISAALASIEAAGGSVVQQKTPVPPGFQARGQLPGGPVIEFAQWDSVEAYRNPDLAALGLI